MERHPSTTQGGSKAFGVSQDFFVYLGVWKPSHIFYIYRAACVHVAMLGEPQKDTFQYITLLLTEIRDGFIILMAQVHEAV